MSLLVTVWDSRDGYDDDAALARSLARNAGWDVASVLITGFGRRAQGVDASGTRFVRVPAPADPPEPLSIQLKAVDDRLLVLRAQLRDLEAGGARRADPHRLRIVAESRGLQKAREKLEEYGAPGGDLVSAVDRLETSAAELVPELRRLAPALVVACGPVALLACVRARVSAVVYSPRTVPGAQLAVRERVEPLVARALASVDPGSPAAVWGAALQAAGVEGAPLSLAPVQAPDADGLAGVRLGVGPAGFAGQAWAWAQAARASLAVQAEVVTVEQEVLNFPADLRPTAQEWGSLDWQLGHLPRALAWTHALSESARPLLGLLNGSVVTGDLPALRRAGVSVGVVCHGSEIRDPRLHGRLYEHSPFGPEYDDVPRLQEVADRNARILAGFSGPVFVSTPDLLDSLPHAVWLPVTVAQSDFAPGPPVLERDVPVVLHAPSSPRWKGTAVIEEVLQGLVQQGLVDYRRLDGVDPAELPALIRDADVVVDHVVVGNYGVLACQALAAGRVVVGHVHERVRRRVPLPVPVLEATPPTLEAVLRSAVADRAPARALAGEGPEFVRALHDGRLAAAVLRPWLAGAVRW
ncbi:hypothetical protein [Motilibacter aurantiacus]|uniref:hypothetical protein n=1 Tax=Motilibacter aurantiacus TaxID=2714955 RepID=UPI00140DFCE7|nr:hypothetical protein [Motilibacter aurantiacus]NHC43849.1 hypothetical protein [Motilibacter aurantiacus]